MTQPLPGKLIDTPERRAMLADAYLDVLRADHRDTRAQLIKRAHDLSADLADLAARMEADPTYCPNPLGVLQSSGQTLERLCARLDEQRKAVKLAEGLQAILQAEQNGAGE